MHDLSIQSDATQLPLNPRPKSDPSTSKTHHPSPQSSHLSIPPLPRINSLDLCASQSPTPFQRDPTSPHHQSLSTLPTPIYIHIPISLRSLDSDNMSSLTQGILQDLAIDKFNETAQDRITQKDPYSASVPPGLSKRDADVLRRCKRRAHQLDHNAVLCYCCPCFFGLNTAICTILPPVLVTDVPPPLALRFRLLFHSRSFGFCCVLLLFTAMVTALVY